MTPRQSETLNFIKRFVLKNSHSPSYQEIADGLSLKGKAGVHYHVNALVKQGHLRKVDKAARSIWPT